LKPTPGRRAALRVLRAARAGTPADRALASALAQVPLRERPWTQELVYGTFRLRGRLDWLLDRLVKRGIAALEPDILDVLRLGAYQLLEMGSVPVYAAVSQAVELAKAASGKGAGGLVNGVLHALVREAPALCASFPAFDDDPAAHLESWGSHPRWLVERWLARWPAAQVRALVEANNTRPELYIRPVGGTVPAAAAALAAAGIGAAPVAGAPDALRIDAPAGAAAALAAVPAVVQDPAAGLVVRYAAPPPGARVADLCAAPGGKALALAAELASRACGAADGGPGAGAGGAVDGAGGGFVVAADASHRRLERVLENVARLAGPGVAPVYPLVADARRPALRAAELVLLDVPCTGTGTLRRHPDGRWRIGAADLAALVALQVEMLDAAAALVPPGGLLVYSTCSLEAEENEAQVEAFLGRHAGFEMAPPAGDDAGVAALLDPAGRLVVLPQQLGVDGAFAARLRRSGP
jgi:16S rRNA (cytosine967-C5)-methyltransferase